MTFHLDTSDPVDVARFCNQVRAMAGTGQYTGEFKKYRATRSQVQNNTYFKFVVSAFRDYLTESWGHEHTNEEAHEELKKLVLGVEVVNPHTGEVKLMVPRTRNKNSAEFSEYYDRAREAVERLIDRKIPDPDPRLRTTRRSVA